MYSRIVVIGAGVSGLTTAIELKRTHPEYDITIIAKNLPGDLDPEYTSPWAGANWHSFATLEDKRLQKLDKLGYTKFMDLAENEPGCGIHAKMNIHYTSDYSFQKAGGKGKEPWFKHFVEEYSIIPKDQLPDGMSFGYKFKTVYITTSIYLNYLMLKAMSMGISIRRVSAIKTVQQALQMHSSGIKAHVVVNCTGLLAKKLGGYKDDKKQFPVLGQILQVRNNIPDGLSVSSLSEDQANESLYIMPRKEGGAIIGGCFRPEFDSVEEDTELTKRIIDRTKRFAPIMLDPNYKFNPDFIDVIRVGVGQRPFRDSGVRVEQDTQHHWLIHNYGAGPGGYQGSFGFSGEVVRLVTKAIQDMHYNAKL